MQNSPNAARVGGRPTLILDTHASETRSMTPRLHRLFLAMMALAIATPATFAGDKEKAEVDRILSAAREESRVMEHLDHLSNRIGPRLTSSDGLTTACEWARDQFKSFGIENARIEKWGEFPVGFNRGPW